MESPCLDRVGKPSWALLCRALALFAGLGSVACASAPTHGFQDGGTPPTAAPELQGLGFEPRSESEFAPRPVSAVPYAEVTLASEHVEGWTSHGPVELALFCCLRGLDTLLPSPAPPPDPVIEPLPTVFEAPPERPRLWYVGVGAGWTTSGLSAGDLEDDLGGSGNDALVTVDDSHGGLKVFAGRRLGERWALEFGYTGLEGHDSEIIESGPPQPGLAEDVAASHPITGEGFALAVRATTPERAGFAAAARLGVWAWRSNLEVNINDTRLVVEDDGFDVFFGLGLQYRASDRTTIRLEWEQYLLDEDDVHLFTIGFHHEM